MSTACEGRKAQWDHLDDVREYDLFDSEGTLCVRHRMCSRCVEDDRAKGWDWREVPHED